MSLMKCTPSYSSFDNPRQRCRHYDDHNHPHHQASRRQGRRRPISWSIFLLLLLLLLFFLLSCPVSAQQAPNPLYQVTPFTEPAMKANVTTANRTTFRNDVCHLATRRDELGLSNILNGVQLHPALMLGEFVTMDFEDDGTGDVTNMTLNEDYPGLIPLLLDALCERAGCTWRDTYAAYPYSILSEYDKSFDELAIWSTNVYDVNLDWWMRSIQRLKAGITFTEKWYDASIILVTKKQESKRGGNTSGGEGFDPFSWLYPFDNNVWYLTMATIVASAGVYWFLEVLNPNADSDDARRIGLGEAIWMFATAFTGQFEFDPQTHPARLFTFSIAMWALLISAAYTANLASFLVIQNTPTNPIETVGQAVRASIPMCVWKSSQTDVSVSAAFPAYAGSGMLKRVDSQQEVYAGIQEGLCDIAITEVSSWEIFQYDSTVNDDCTLQWIGRAFEFAPASFVLTSDAGDLCTSLLRTVFDLHLHDMERDGIIAELWEKHIEQTATVFCTGDDNDNGTSRKRRRRRLQQGQFRHLKTANNAAPESGSGDGGFDETTQLNLDNMGGVFLLHGVLTTIAVICAIISWHLEKSKKTREEEAAAAAAIGKGDIMNKLESAPYNPSSNKEYSTRESITSDAFYDAVEGNSQVDLLRNEMMDRFSAIEDKLERLLQDQDRRAVLADQGMRLEYS